MTRHKVNAPKKAFFRPRYVAAKVKASMPRKAPQSWKVVPKAFTVSTVACGEPFSAVEINSGEKNPMPHNPAIPANPKQTPTNKFLPQTGSLTNSPIDPTFLPPL